MGNYSPAGLRKYFDDFADKEWARLEDSLRGRISYLIHRRFLMERAAPGMRALDVGCGPGRFAIDLLRAGVATSIIDLSPVQLGLAREHIAAEGLSAGLERSAVGDTCNLSELETDSFDLVVAYGGVLSYTCERHGEALGELVRVARPGGHVVLGVMPIGGTMRLLAPLDAAGFLEDFDRHLDWDPPKPHAGWILSRRDSNEFHQPIALFSARYLRIILERLGCDVVACAAANPVSTLVSPMPKVEASERATARLIEVELALCDVPELVESGSHMIMVARKRS